MANAATTKRRRQKLLADIREFPCLSTSEYTDQARPATRWQTYRDLEWLRKHNQISRYRNPELDRLDKHRGSGAWYWKPCPIPVGAKS